MVGAWHSSYHLFDFINSQPMVWRNPLNGAQTKAHRPLKMGNQTPLHWQEGIRPYIITIYTSKITDFIDHVGVFAVAVVAAIALVLLLVQQFPLFFVWIFFFLLFLFQSLPLRILFPCLFMHKLIREIGTTKRSLLYSTISFSLSRFYIYVSLFFVSLVCICFLFHSHFR